MSARVVFNGSPCTCKDGRYVRFVVQAAPGIDGVISCRGNVSPQRDVREHPIPANAIVLVRMPGVA